MQNTTVPQHPSEPAEAGAAFTELVQLMDTLRSPGGCPWDAEQSHESLVRYLIEESYEVVEAIEQDSGVDYALLQEELGDVLLQVVFHARVAEEADPAQRFTVADVVAGLNEKLRRRHPHVFAGESKDLNEVRKRWEELKQEEKPERTSIFDGIPPHLPALALAEKTLSKAAKGGVDVHERKSMASSTTFTTEEELGEFLFDVVAGARAQGLDPERALRAATRRFIAEN